MAMMVSVSLLDPKPQRADYQQPLFAREILTTSNASVQYHNSWTGSDFPKSIRLGAA